MIVFVKLAYWIIGVFFVILFSYVMMSGLEQDHDLNMPETSFGTILNPLEFNTVFDTTKNKLTEFFFGKVGNVKNLPLEYKIQSYSVDWNTNMVNVVENNGNKQTYSLSDGHGIQFLFELFLSFK